MSEVGTGPVFADPDFQFALDTALGASYRQAADVGEVLSTAGRIEDGDCDSWVTAWTATAERLYDVAESADRAGHRVSALDSYRRAATYFATALYRIWHSSQPRRAVPIWRCQRVCWEKVVDLSPSPGQRISIRYEDTTLPAFFFRAPDAAPGERRPLIVLNNGSNGATSQMWVSGGAAAADRGYHWMTFDGPGQQATLFEQHIHLRPDWEAVLTPVLDAMLARDDVESDHVAVIGISQAGYWVPRALGFEHRCAAAVVDPGVVDVSTLWTDPLPGPMRKRLADGDQAAFDREMDLGELFSPTTAATMRFRGTPYGPHGGSRFALYQSVRAYRLGTEVGQITTPMLVTDPEGEPFWPGQSRQLYDRLQGTKRLVAFSADHGAAGHCEPLGAAQREARIFDWLQNYLGSAGQASSPPS